MQTTTEETMPTENTIEETDTLTFAGLAGGKTRLTLRHSGFWDEASRVSHTGGWNSAADRFVDYIAL